MKECNCGNYKPYIETMEVGAIYAPMMPFNACVNCYGESMKETLPRPCEHGRLKRQCNECDLQAQNDELRAKLHNLQVEILDMSCAKENNSGFEPSLSVYQRSIDIVIAEARKTPAQTLADIRAEAVMSIMDKAHSCETPNGDIAYSSELIHDHANNIKGAE